MSDSDSDSDSRMFWILEDAISLTGPEHDCEKCKDYDECECECEEEPPQR